MADIDDDPRKFEDLDAHGVQEALRAEISNSPDEEEGDDDHSKETKLSKSNEPADEELEDDEAMADDSEDDSEDDTDGETVDEVWTAAQMADHVRMAEALLFAAVEPLDQNSLSDRLPAGADVPAILEILKAQYENRGVVLSKIEKKWRFTTAPDVAHVLEKERIEPRKLSKAALETLAIIAYHQPCTRADIEDVRGVAVARGSLDQLLDIGWVRLRGRRKDVPGRPVLYGTNQAFLEHFGLEGVGDLPGMAELKAAGLLEARLPPDFQVPTPQDGDGEDEEGEEDAEFVSDFLEQDPSAELAEEDGEGEVEDGDLDDERAASES